MSKHMEQHYHDTDRLGNGRRIVKRGSGWWLTDSNGSPVGEGFHKLRWDGELYRGKRGAARSLVSEDGELLTDNYHAITGSWPNYLGTRGAADYDIELFEVSPENHCLAEGVQRTTDTLSIETQREPSAGY